MILQKLTIIGLTLLVCREHFHFADKKPQDMRQVFTSDIYCSPSENIKYLFLNHQYTLPP